jgi:acyl-coenzyme A synthetase/AMP-(fatty) acid ligase
LLEAVPEFLVVLLAAEKIGASVVCGTDSIEENAGLIRKAGARIMFAHDYISQEAVDACSEAGIERLILINPWKLTRKEQLPQHIITGLKSRYAGPKVTDGCVCLWDDFLSASRIYIGKTDAQQDIARPLLHLTCRDLQGNSFPVVHSSQSLLGTIHQIVCCGSGTERTAWLNAAVSPASAEAVVSLMLAPICAGHTLILDPFVAENDLDLELMRCKPGAWALSPSRLESLINSSRIPADYDMSHLQVLTAGTEAVGDGLSWRIQQFLTTHRCTAVFCACYGREEAASAVTLPAPGYEFGSGIIGIPMPLNTAGIFRGTEECGYNRRGEICFTGPGLMPAGEAQALIRHEDGLLWLHTGDFGYMNEEGVIYAPSRIPAEARTDENPLRRLALELETRLNASVIPGLVDYFFLVTPDRKKADSTVPYLYAVTEEGYTPAAIREDVRNTLENQTVELVPLPEESFRLLRASRVNL